VTERRPPKSSGIVPGSRVTLRRGALTASRQHLVAHAMHGDTGTVVEPRAGRPGWTLVRFDDCPTIHRLTENEISLSQRPKS
jgi:hypothetical protein